MARIAKSFASLVIASMKALFSVYSFLLTRWVIFS